MFAMKIEKKMKKKVYVNKLYVIYMSDVKCNKI